MTSPWTALANTAINDVTMTNLIENRLDTLDAQVAACPAELDSNQITAASASFTTIADITGLSISFTLTTARIVDIWVYAIVQSTLANDRLQLTLADNANVQLQVTGDLFIPANSSSVPGWLFWRGFLSAGPYGMKVRANRQAGSGTCVVNAAATRPAFIKAVGW